MQTFETQLLREKFLILDPAKQDGAYDPVKALSNRIVLTFPKKEGEHETLIVRAQNMHSCLRFAGQIVQSYITAGPLIGRVKRRFWTSAYDHIENDYEHLYNPNLWVAVYRAGKAIYEQGERHPFLDLIEKCDFESNQDYDHAFAKAEETFKTAGKIVRIEHESNVALTIRVEDQKLRCGIILRNPTRQTTFSYTVTPKPKDKDKSKNKNTDKIADRTINIAQNLFVCAAFLEGVELAFMAGMNVEKIRLGIIEAHSKEDKKTKAAFLRLNRLKAEIHNLEEAFTVRYRPDKPEFATIAIEAEHLAQTILRPSEDAEFISLEASLKDKEEKTNEQTTTSPPKILPPRSKSAKNNVLT